MKVPDKYKDKISQEKLDEWYDDAATTCCERMEDPSEEDIEIWATFCVEQRLEQEFDEWESIITVHASDIDAEKGK
ncbi:MAG TPA: hypothetical protein PKI14_04360 [Fervidobacterium sp.]|nr:hypothetical protein [Fervidobacterium sp.]